MLVAMLRLAPALTRTLGAALVLLAFAGACEGEDEDATGPSVTFKVMTRNLYLGSDLIDVVTAGSRDEIPVRVAKLWANVKDSDIPARAKRLAAEIAEHKPDLVGLQEVEIFRTQHPSDFVWGSSDVLNAQDVQFDLLTLLKKELEALSEKYVVAVEAPYTDAELPGALEAGALTDVRMTDRDVILVKEGLAFSNPRHMPYNTFIPLPVAGAMGVTVPMRRGVGLVDVTRDGAVFTFANTHLEVGGPAAAFQESQARDLLKVLKATPGTQVVLGDFNSAPVVPYTTKSYGLVAEFLTDAWTKLKPGDAGFTCCSELKDANRSDTSRIDIVFYRGKVTPLDIQVIGIDPGKRTENGLWPSDHAGVVATLGVQAR